MRKRYYCPVCRSPRYLDLAERITLKMHAKILLFCSGLSLFAYISKGPALAMKMALVYLPIWAMAELVVWRRSRKESACKVCLFDPILYQKDWRGARSIVESRMLEIKKNRDELWQKKHQQIKAQIQAINGPDPLKNELLDVKNKEEIATLAQKPSNLLSRQD